jgi:hypothetical protein
MEPVRSSVLLAPADPDLRAAGVAEQEVGERIARLSRTRAGELTREAELNFVRPKIDKDVVVELDTRIAASDESGGSPMLLKRPPKETCG